MVNKPKQWKALCSPVRLEIVEALELFGQSSIAEVALELERTPHSLYHHIRRLAEVELIKRVGSRRSGAREQALYDVSGRPVIHDDRAWTPMARRQRIRAARFLLRQAEREYQASVEATRDPPTGPAEVRRYRVRLRGASVRKIKKHLDAIVALILDERLRASDKARDVGWISWTSILSPQPPSDEA